MEYHQQEEYWMHSKANTDYLFKILTTIFWEIQSRTSCKTRVTSVVYYTLTQRLKLNKLINQMLFLL